MAYPTIPERMIPERMLPLWILPGDVSPSTARRRVGAMMALGFFGLVLPSLRKRGR